MYSELSAQSKSMTFKYLRHFSNAPLATSIRHLTSIPCSQSSFTHVPRYLYFFTFPICFPLALIAFLLHFVFFKNHIYLVLFILRDNLTLLCSILINSIMNQDCEKYLYYIIILWRVRWIGQNSKCIRF